MNTPRRIILSRKGFDSTERYGGKPSPILGGTELFSLPIPQSGKGKRNIRYQDIKGPNVKWVHLGSIVHQLTKGALRAGSYAHLDPDLRCERDAILTFPRMSGWRPLFGQGGHAETHLSNQGVGKGDLFLFYGLHRPARITGKRIRYERAKKRHVIWGWMLVGDVWHVRSEKDVPLWARYHAHAKEASKTNTVYVAASQAFGSLPGAGIFPNYHADLCLTHLQGNPFACSTWRLPFWCRPINGRFPFTFSSDPRRWTVGGREVLLRTKSPGQEFVLDTEDYPEAIEWARNLISAHGSKRKKR